MSLLSFGQAKAGSCAHRWARHVLQFPVLIASLKGFLPKTVLAQGQLPFPVRKVTVVWEWVMEKQQISTQSEAFSTHSHPTLPMTLSLQLFCPKRKQLHFFMYLLPAPLWLPACPLSQLQWPEYPRPAVSVERSGAEREGSSPGGIRDKGRGQQVSAQPTEFRFPA